MRRALANVMTGLVMANGAGAVAQAADADHGEVIAKRWCATCHVVAEDQKRGAADVPSFASVGKRPDFNAGKLAQFLRDPHPKMPNMELSRSESDDIAAYIGRLGR